MTAATRQKEEREVKRREAPPGNGASQNYVTGFAHTGGGQPPATSLMRRGDITDATVYHNFPLVTLRVFGCY